MSRDSRFRRRGRDTDGGSVCHNCNETGHISRDCSQRGGSGGTGGSRFFSRSFSSVATSSTCYNCNQSGQISRDCTHNEQGEWGGGRGGRRGRGGRGRSCFNCDEVGHIARDCPQRGSGERGRGRGGGRVVIGGGGRVSYNFTRLGGRGRGVFRGRSSESEVKPTHIFFDDDDD